MIESAHTAMWYPKSMLLSNFLPPISRHGPLHTTVFAPKSYTLDAQRLFCGYLAHLLEVSGAASALGQAN